MKRENDVVKIGEWDSLPSEMKFQIFNHLSLKDLKTFAEASTQSSEEVVSYLETVPSSNDPQIKTKLLKQLSDYVKTTGDHIVNIQTKMQANQKRIQVAGAVVVVIAGFIAFSNPVFWPAYAVGALGLVTFLGAKHIARVINLSHEEKVEKFNSIFQPLKKAVTNLEQKIVNSKSYQPLVEQQADVDDRASYRFSLLKALTRRSVARVDHDIEAQQNEDQNNNINSFTK